MEEDATSTVSNCRERNLIDHVAALSETSDYSNNSNSAGKRPKLGSKNFKGVVAQPNGNWGAQIYANHQRVWLGTFKSEEEAAMAYDSAAIKLRSGDSHRNFPWSEVNVQEPGFQRKFTTKKILNMIKDGSYQSKFNHFLSQHCQELRSDDDDACVQLFHKELTPSDVGKLNRLVIPKKFAVKFFPYIDIINGGGGEDIEIVFYDRLRRMWKFRYCYWKSSQSFVFTRGWNRFVKEKKLKEKDVVTFYACGHGGHTFYLVDDRHSLSGRQIISASTSGRHIGDTTEMQLDLNLGPVKSSDDDEDKGGFRLFGVTIDHS